jgi:uncharacterized protein (TIGR03435 family)
MIMPDHASLAGFAADHLWQSTLTAAIAAGLAWTLRASEARLRHAIWMLASLKFFLPFALLEQVGRQLATRRVGDAPYNAVLTTVLDIGKPFTGSPANLHAHGAASSPFPWTLSIALLWAAGAAVVGGTWFLRMQRVRRLVRASHPVHAGREAGTLRHLETLMGLRHPVPLLISSDCMEPGIFGIVRPVLLWPEGISAHLDDNQIASIVAHELWHVRRRDNLLALLHMLVEAVFWFHPLVWWMGARLLEERERSCDEAVLQIGNEPAQYADAILKACRFCVESPLTCISGVSGSDLKRRMVQIMNPATIPLSRSRKMLLATIALAAIAGPIGIGVLHPRVVRADEAQNFASLKFDSASLTPIQGGDNFFFMQHDDEFVLKNVTMKNLIATAYGVKPERIVGGPGWIDSQRFDFEAHWTPTAGDHMKVPGAARTESDVAVASTTIGGPGHEPTLAPMPTPAPVQAMLRNFLSERAGLRVRDDSTVLPVYELVVAAGASKLTPTQEQQPSPAGKRVEMKTRVEVRAHDGGQSFSMTNADPRLLCENLSRQVGHEVIDKTGLTGRYDFEISLPAHPDPDQLAAILRDQYGLDLQPTQQPVKVFAVDNVDMPQNNN